MDNPKSEFRILLLRHIYAVRIDCSTRVSQNICVEPRHDSVDQFNERISHLRKRMPEMLCSESDASDLDQNCIHPSLDHLGEQLGLVPLPEIREGDQSESPTSAAND